MQMYQWIDKNLGHLDGKFMRFAIQDDWQVVEIYKSIPEVNSLFMRNLKEVLR